MKQRVGILAAVIALAVMLTVVATSDTRVAHAVPLSQSTSLLQGDVDALNVILINPTETADHNPRHAQGHRLTSLTTHRLDHRPNQPPDWPYYTFGPTSTPSSPPPTRQITKPLETRFYSPAIPSPTQPAIHLTQTRSITQIRTRVLANQVSTFYT